MQESLTNTAMMTINTTGKASFGIPSMSSSRTAGISSTHVIALSWIDLLLAAVQAVSMHRPLLGTKAPIMTPDQTDSSLFLMQVRTYVVQEKFGLCFWTISMDTCGFCLHFHLMLCALHIMVHCK